MKEKQLKTVAGRNLVISIYKYPGIEYGEKLPSRNTLAESDPKKKKYYYLHHKPFDKNAIIKWTFDIEYKEDILVNIYDIEIIGEKGSGFISQYVVFSNIATEYKLREAFYTGDFTLTPRPYEDKYSFEARQLQLENRTRTTIPEEIFDTPEEVEKYIINRFIQ